MKLAELKLKRKLFLSYPCSYFGHTRPPSRCIVRYAQEVYYKYIIISLYIIIDIVRNQVKVMT